MLDLLTVQSSAAYPTVITMAYTLLLAFVCSTAIGFTYEHTFLGLSYSRNFVQALVLSSVVAATVMRPYSRWAAGSTRPPSRCAVSCMP